MKWLAVATVAFGVAGCSQQTSNPAPTRMTTPVTVSDQASTIRLPVGIPLADLEKTINAEVPTRLYTIDEPQQVCVKTKSKLLPDITCRLTGQVDRGPIRLSGSGKALVLTIPIRTAVSAENIGKLIKRETATGAIDVKAKVIFGLAPDWQPQAKITADYSWRDRIGIDFLGQRITFESQVDPKLREMLGQLERNLPRQLAKLQAREKVEALWAKGFTVVRAQSEPQIWIRFTPQQVGYSGYHVKNQQLIIDFSAKARTETLFGDRPEPAPVTPLPNLMRALPPGGINVHVPTLVKYEVLEAAARKALMSGAYRALIQKDDGPNDAEIHNITIYGTTNDRVAIGLDLSLKTFSGALSTKGRIWFVAAPVVDIDARVVRLRDLQVAGETDSSAFNVLLDAINKTSLRDRMVQAIRYDFAKDYEAGLRKADKWLEAEPFEGFVFRGDLGDAHIRDVRIAPDGLLVEADATGTGAMTYAPKEAMKLVAQRKARRAEREAAKARAAAKTANGSAP